MPWTSAHRSALGAHGAASALSPSFTLAPFWGGGCAGREGGTAPPVLSAGVGLVKIKSSPSAGSALLCAHTWDENAAPGPVLRSVFAAGRAEVLPRDGAESHLQMQLLEPCRKLGVLPRPCPALKDPPLLP